MAFAVIKHHNHALDAIRKRIAELNTTYAAIEDLAGLQPGYLGKVLRDPPPKRVQPFLLFTLFQTVGLNLYADHDPEFNEKMLHRLAPRKAKRRVPSGSTSEIIRIELTRDMLRHRGSRGGRARAKLPNISDINRRAALTRWRRVPERGRQQVA